MAIWQTAEILPGVRLHSMQTDKFHSGYFSLELLCPLQAENVSRNALLMDVLRRGTRSCPDMTRITERLHELSGAVIATGGGVVVRERNLDSLHRNGRIAWLKRDVTKLPDDDRPLSKLHGAEELYRQREPLYRQFADADVDILPDADTSAQLVLKALRTLQSE